MPTLTAVFYHWINSISYNLNCVLWDILQKILIYLYSICMCTCLPFILLILLLINISIITATAAVIIFAINHYTILLIFHERQNQNL